METTETTDRPSRRSFLELLSRGTAGAAAGIASFLIPEASAKLPANAFKGGDYDRETERLSAPEIAAYLSAANGDAELQMLIAQSTRSLMEIAPVVGFRVSGPGFVSELISKPYRDATGGAEPVFYALYGFTDYGDDHYENKLTVDMNGEVRLKDLVTGELIAPPSDQYTAQLVDVLFGVPQEPPPPPKRAAETPRWVLCLFWTMAICGAAEVQAVSCLGTQIACGGGSNPAMCLLAQQECAKAILVSWYCRFIKWYCRKELQSLIDET